MGEWSVRLCPLAGLLRRGLFHSLPLSVLVGISRRCSEGPLCDAECFCQPLVARARWLCLCLNLLWFSRCSCATCSQKAPVDFGAESARPLSCHISNTARLAVMVWKSLVCVVLNFCCFLFVGLEQAVQHSTTEPYPQTEL
jgi:hypothetical protein